MLINKANTEAQIKTNWTNYAIIFLFKTSVANKSTRFFTSDSNEFYENKKTFVKNILLDRLVILCVVEMNESQASDTNASPIFRKMCLQLRESVFLIHSIALIKLFHIKMISRCTVYRQYWMATEKKGNKMLSHFRLRQIERNALPSEIDELKIQWNYFARSYSKSIEKYIWII